MVKIASLLILVIFSVFINPSYSKAFGDKKALTIYPNPANEKLTIELQSEKSTYPEIKIFDLTGKLIIKFEKQCFYEQEIFKAELDISDLSTGIYFVKLIQGDTTFTEKLVVN